MTLPYEERWSLSRTRELLRRLNMNKITTLRKDIKDIQAEARSCLKHYPMDYRIESLYKTESKKEPDEETRNLKYKENL